MNGGRVLVTGASGFIAKHCIAELTRHGWDACGTLRDPAKAEAVRAAVARGGGEPGRVTFTTADLLSDTGWGEVMRGIAYVLHVASPFPLTPPTSRDEVLRPAREGTQ